MMLSHEVILRTEGLTKVFGPITAVKDLDLQIQRGQVFGFLGPNGAGKTTTIRLLLGLLRPTAGRIEIFGLDLAAHLPQILRRIGALAENPAFYPFLSGRDNLRVMALASDGVSRGRIEEVLAMVGLAQRAKDRFATYSQGMKQRLAVACALLNDPELLILDEPTNGLDPAGMREMREFIRSLSHAGKTVFLSSHLLHEVQQVCDAVAVLNRGVVIAQGPVAELLRRGRFLQLRVSPLERAQAVLQGVAWIPTVRVEGELLLVEAPSERASEVSAILAAAGLFPSEIKVQEDSLERFFLEVTENVGGEADA